MSRKPSHIPLFPDAYLRDTMHLTTEEHGAYFMLILAAWGNDDCALPNDEKRLAALAKLPLARWRKIAPTVLEFWTIDKGRISQKRLRKEWQYVRSKSEQAKAAVAQRKDRNGYGRCTDVATDVVHLGGGEGGGPFQGISYQGESVSAGDDARPFGVIEGGK